MSKKPVILFDIDGTLADISHRRNDLESAKKNWAKFNSSMDKDTPNMPIVRLYRTLWNSGDYEIIILSGREETFRKVTEQWLIWNEIPFERVLMRPAKDYRADNIVKKSF